MKWKESMNFLKEETEGRDREEMIFLLLSWINMVSRFRFNYF